MRTIYLDELFFLNLCIDYFLLLATAKICALPFRRRRFALAASMGAVWCCLALLPSLAFLRLTVSQAVLGLGMTLIAFGREKHIFRCFFAFLGVSALFGGAVYAAALYRGISPSGPFVRLDMRVLALSFGLCWALVSLVFRRAAKQARRVVHEVTLERDGRVLHFRALEDTGNGLYDPLSGCAAVVTEAETVAELFPGLDSSLLSDDPIDAVTRVQGARLIPCADIGGRSRLLLAFRPDGINVDGEQREDLIIAVAPAHLGGDGSYQAIL